MSLLSANNLSQTYAFVDVFTGISVTVTPDAKIGLIGPNGVGKTTLLRILAGAEEQKSGELHIARGKRVGYLPQEAMDAFNHPEHTVYQEMLTVFDHLHAIEARMRELEVQMASDMSVMDEYGNLQDKFEHSGGYDYETRIKQTLDGLGFTQENRDSIVGTLSGGQKTRALLAKLLLQAPDLLILDEPTNHLDVEAIDWLEGLLADWPGAIIACSHDRYFLDRAVNRIWEMSKTNVEVYRGNYTAYLTQRDERFDRSVFVFDQEKSRLENDARLIKRDFDQVKGGFSDKDLSWAKGKLKRLTTDVVVIEIFGAEALLNEKWSDLAPRLIPYGGTPATFGVDEAVKRVDRLRSPARPPKLNLTLTALRRSGEIVLRTKSAVIGYGPDAPLFKCDDIEMNFKDRVALIGPNGSGKTTFLKTTLASRTLDDDHVDIGQHPAMALKPVAGLVEVGSSIRVGYFAQAHSELDPDGTIESELLRHAEGERRRMNEGELRYYMAQYLFKDDDLAKPIRGLSGGERARLALAILSLRGANFLVLDEPTNHLDIATQEVLESVLGQFEGSILLVSHDRYLISRLAQQIWSIHAGRLRAFRGPYAEYSSWRAREKRTSGV